MNYKDLSAEQKEKVAALNTPEEFVAFAQSEGIELSDEDLEQLSGGGWLGHQCPKCGSYDVDMTIDGLICDACGYGKR